MSIKKIIESALIDFISYLESKETLETHERYALENAHESLLAMRKSYRGVWYEYEKSTLLEAYENGDISREDLEAETERMNRDAI